MLEWHPVPIMSKEYSKYASKPKTFEDGVENKGADQYDGQHSVQLNDAPVNTFAFHIKQFFLLFQNNVRAILVIVVRKIYEFMILLT